LAIVLLATGLLMGSVTAKIMKERREVRKMGDAGGGGGETADLAEQYGEYDLFSSEPAIGAPEGAYEFGGNVSLGDFGLSSGAGEPGRAETPSRAISLRAGEPSVTPTKEEPAKEPAKKPETEAAKEVTEEKKPVITRAKRRRSLLTEEEGGVLRKPTVYRRNLLGK
jgi:hypothetical protein